jgi:hypothetical protein
VVQSGACHVILADGVCREFVNKAKLVGEQNADVREQTRVGGRAPQPQVAFDLSALIQSVVTNIICWHILEILKY